MTDPAVLTVLAFGHVLSAVGWLGGGLLTAFIVAPGLRTMSGQAGLEFTAKVIPRAVRYLTGMIVGTFVFGLLLLYFGGYYSTMAPSSAHGVALSAGVGLAVVTAIIGLAVTFPSFRKMASMADASLKSGQQPSADMARYAQRARVGSLVATLLLVIVLALMVTAGFY